jgi:glycosyltransferase involved in cell wall biosynthesis
MRRTLVANGAPEAQIVVLPYFVEPPSDSLLSDPPADGPLLFVGRLADSKGLDVLLHALPAVAGGVRLEVVGDGWHLPLAREVVKTLEMGERVSFVGWESADGVGQRLQGARCLVVPSIWPEPFGIVGLEAMGWARPVIASRVGGITEWLDDGKTGLLAEPGSSADLARAIWDLLAEPARARAMGQEGRKRVEARFSVANHVAGLLAECDRAATESRADGRTPRPRRA